MKMAPISHRSLNIVIMGILFPLMNVFLILMTILGSQVADVTRTHWLVYGWPSALIFSAVAVFFLDRKTDISARILALPTPSFIFFSVLCVLLSPWASLLSDPILGSFMGEQSAPILEITEVLWFGPLGLILPWTIPLIIVLWSAAFLWMIRLKIELMK